MTPDALLAQILGRSDQILWLWNFYVVVAAALIVYALGSQALRADRRAFRLVAGGFVFFAYTNLECMRWVVKQWVAVAAAFRETAAYAQASAAVREQLDGVISAPHPLWIVPFHLALDALVLVVVWRARRRGSPPAAAGGL